MFRPVGSGLERGWPGRIDGERVVQLAAQTLQAFFTGGGSAREHAEYALDEVELLAPVLHPPNVRVFEGFVRSERPFFSFRTSGGILGPDESLAYPDGTAKLDFGLAVAAVVGADGAVAGFTIANDWTARDLEREERAHGTGPAKSKDFALSLGPSLLTPDEFDASEGAIVARVDGRERGRVELGELAFTWQEMVEHAARNTSLRPGDLVLCSAPGSNDSWLRPGAEVVVELEPVGALRNTVAVRT